MKDNKDLEYPQFDFKFALGSGSKELKVSKRTISEKTSLGYYNLSYLPAAWNPRIQTLAEICDSMNVDFGSFALRASGDLSPIKLSDRDHTGFADIINTILHEHGSKSKIKQKSTFKQLILVCDKVNLSVFDLLYEAEKRCNQFVEKIHTPFVKEGGVRTPRD